MAVKRFGSKGSDVDKTTGDEYEQGSLPPEQRATEVIWNRAYTSKSDYYGVPDSLPATGAMYGDRSRTIYNIAFFENFGVPSFAVTIAGDFDEGEVDETTKKSALQTAIEEKVKDMAQNPHSVMVLTVPSTDAESKVTVNFEKLAVETKEASFRLFRLDNRDEIVTAHGMDPYRIGIAATGSLGGNTAIESKKNYKSTTVHPKQRTWESRINLFIIQRGFEIYDWEFSFVEIDTEDKVQEVTIGAQLFNMAVLTPNDLIRRFGDDWGIKPVDHPAMDGHYINGNRIDVDENTIQQQQDAANQAAATEAMKAIKSMQKELIAVVKSYEDGNQDGSGDGKLLKRIKGLRSTS